MKLKLFFLIFFCLNAKSIKIDYKIKDEQKALISCSEVILDFIIEGAIPSTAITLIFKNSSNEFIVNGQTNNNGDFLFSINAAVLLAKINCNNSCKDFLLEVKVGNNSESITINNNFCVGCTFPLDNLDLSIIEKYR